jgi:hypothetical protein
MRILANYGYKANGDTYSVTFETMGDVPKDQADACVDELFRLAKAAIERQINPAPREVDPAPEETPGPSKNGKGKPVLKDPTAPATRKQKNLIIRLAKEKGQFIENLNELTMQEASQTIDELMAL